MSGWDTPVRAKSRLRTKPKRYFADPSLAASLLQVTPAWLIEDGQLFESLCMRDLAVYASALPHATADSLHYYRDSDSLEVDAVIELRDGRWAAFEIKLGENKVDEAAASLNRLRRKVAANPPHAIQTPSSQRSSSAQASLRATIEKGKFSCFPSPVSGMRERRRG